MAKKQEADFEWKQSSSNRLLSVKTRAGVTLVAVKSSKPHHTLTKYTSKVLVTWYFYEAKTPDIDGNTIVAVPVINPVKGKPPEQGECYMLTMEERGSFIAQIMDDKVTINISD